MLDQYKNIEQIKSAKQSISAERIPVSKTKLFSVDANQTYATNTTILNNNIEFHIYGDGKERSSLENNAHAYNLNNINFHGSVLKADVPDVLNKANLLFVSTSNVLYGSENKLYEYMAAGKPIVVASAGNHNNPVEIVDCGVSLNRDDVKEAAQTLSEFIIKQASNFAIFGKNGQDYAHNNRRLDVLGKDLENFLTNIKDSFNDRA